MRHLKAGKKLNRSPSHRKALYRNLTMALIQNERIITTLPKAKAVRPFVEKLITLARKGTLHARRLVISRLGPSGQAQVNPSDEGESDTRTVVQKLFDEIGPRFANRPGGYTRIVKLHKRRLGDGGETAILELLMEGETKVRLRTPAPAPAPSFTEEEEQEQADAGEQTPSPEESPEPEASGESPETGEKPAEEKTDNQ